MNEDKPVARGDMRTPAEREREGDVTRDPLGRHPIGTAVGGVAGAVAAGAAVGTVAGPIGTAVGAVVGALAGGMTGRAVADMVDPRAEDEYWRQNWNTRDYVDNQYSYDQDYSSAYRYGVDAYTQNPGRNYDEIESDLSTGWDSARGESRLDWSNARHATHDAWQRVSDTVERAVPGDSDRDGK